MRVGGVLALGLAVGAGACSEAAEYKSSRPLALELASGTWPAPEERVVRSLELPAELDPSSWFTIFNDGAEVVELPDPGGPGEAAQARAILVPPAKQPFFLRVPVDVDAAAFDLVRIRYACPGFTRVAALVGRATKRYTISDFAEREAFEAGAIDLDMSMLVADDRHLSELHLAFEVVTHEATLYGIELIQRPPSMRLPSPLEPPRHFPVDTESRPAVGLLPGLELAALVPPDARGWLSIEASLPPAVPASNDRTLSMELYAGERLLSAAAFALDSRWSQHRLPLDGLAGRPAGAPLRLALRTTSAFGALVGSPRILAGERPASAGPPRTVTLITSDTHRADHVGYAPGGAGVHTPTLDRLAADGVSFTRAGAVTSITNPSHATIFTGRHVRDTGIIGNLVPLAEAAWTVAEEFEAAGFRTFAAVSARHLMPWRSGFGQGFERFGAPDKQMTREGDETVAEARAMLADAAEHDVFLWLHLFEAHAPYEPQETTELYYQGDPYAEEHGELGVEVRPQWNKRIRDERYIRALYKGEVSRVDWLLGSFFEAVPRVRAGHVLFTADHGESLGENGIFWEHVGIYPSTLEVPLVIAGPGVPQGVVVDDPVSHEDLARTLLELAGVSGTAAGTAFPGRSLLETVGRGSAPRAPRFVIGSGGMSAGVFSEQWYLLLHIDTKAWGNPRGPARHSVELYDRGPDPGCTRNVVAEHPDVARRLRGLLVEWLAHPAEGGRLAGSLTTSAVAREDIAALGYAADEESALEGTLIDPECPCAECAKYR